MHTSEPNPTDLHGVLDRFEVESNQIVESFLSDITSQAPPSIIYHYTNDSGLKGILETGIIWLSDVFKLNDPSELSYGFSIFLECLRNRAPELHRIAVTMQVFLDRIQDSAQYFICSFSEDGDDLGQWRAYADNGCGYALGFDAKALETAFAAQMCGQVPNSATFPVTYNDAKLANVHNKIIDSFQSLRSRIKQSETTLQEDVIKFLVLLAAHAAHASLYFKHQGYSNEREYRFLRVFEANHPLAEMKLRFRPYSAIKYIEFDWKNATQGALKEIVVGPAAEFSKASRFARECARMFYAGTISISRSNIPFRP